MPVSNHLHMILELIMVVAIGVYVDDVLFFGPDGNEMRKVVDLMVLS